MRRWPGAAFAVALASGLACGAGSDAPETSAQPVLRVLLIGDSITAGQVSAPKGPPYAQLLAEALGPGFEIVNLGCGGTSTLDWTRSRGAPLCGGEYTVPNIYEKRVRPALPADLVTVLLGTNDSQGIQEDHRVTVEEYEAALRELCADLLADGAGRVMLMGPPLVIHKVKAMMRLVAYGDAVARVCADVEGVFCGPDVRYLLKPEDFAVGNIHPNAEGHRKIAEALTAALRAFQAGEEASSSEAAAPSSSPG